MNASTSSVPVQVGSTSTGVPFGAQQPFRPSGDVAGVPCEQSTTSPPFLHDTNTQSWTAALIDALGLRKQSSSRAPNRYQSMSLEPESAALTELPLESQSPIVPSVLAALSWSFGS